MGSRKLVVHILALFLLFAAACSGNESSSRASGAASPADASTPPPATAASGVPAPTATQEPAQLPTEPDGARILELVEAFAVTIGPRPTGTDAELTAAEYAAGVFESLGYEVELQQFPIGREVGRQSSFSQTQPGERIVASVPFANSGSGEIEGRLRFAGLGSSAEIPEDASGSILLIERGDLFFQEKVTNAAAAGAIGVVIFNNELGLFFGTLQTTSGIPALSISQEEGQALEREIRAGRVDVKLSVGDLSDAVSFNVIARPESGRCATVSGGHYDSVVQAAGASDNASGSATVIEIAAVLAGRGANADHCFVLFGAEEVGLIGSRAFVDSLTAAERDQIEIMLNFDMVGVGSDGWLLIGAAAEQNLAQAVAQDAGVTVLRGQLPASASSDHASFIAAGIPALMIHRTTDSLLHTPQDTIERVDPELLEQAARLGIALLESIAEGAS